MLRSIYHSVALVLLLGVSCRADLTLRYTVEVKIPGAMPPAIAKVLEEQLAASLPRERVLRVKGDKTLSNIGALIMILDNPSSAVTLLNPATKQYARLSVDEYLAGLQAIAPAPPEALKGIRFDVQNNKTGQVGMVSGIRAEEHLTTLSISMDLPGAPNSSGMRLEMHTWLASPDDLIRVPALRQYGAYAQRALGFSNVADAAERLFIELPGVSEKMRAAIEELTKNPGSLTLKTTEVIYGPTGNQLIPVIEVRIDLAEISTDAIDDAVFAVPPDYRIASAAELIKARMPAPKAPAPAARPADLGPGEQVSKVGAGVSAPRVIYKVDPKYTTEATKARLAGGVTLKIVVDKDGTPRNIQIVHSLGMGLDEEAIKAVSQWKFRPGEKDGQPVNVSASIEVNFRLVDRPAPDAGQK